MSIVTKPIHYEAATVACNGVCAYDDASSASRPLILVVHDWSGCNEFVVQKAKQLAMLGYVGFAIDMYGGGRLGKTKDEKVALMQPLMQDRHLLLSRIQAAYQAAKQLPHVDMTKTGVIGFCFGGLCALDLARSGAPLKGAVSFHGLLTPRAEKVSDKIHASILVLHGCQDPMATQETVITFSHEMQAMQADYQIYLYGNTMHAFSNPGANDPSFGTVYNPLTDKRAWQSMRTFFAEVMG